MTARQIKTLLSTAALLAVLAPATAQAAPLLNGSLEDLQGNFVNTAANYMALSAGSTAIADWTVAPATSGAIVWAESPTGDGYHASNGNFFVDLTGFGANSSNGAIQQTLSIIGGGAYSFSIDLASFNNANTVVTIGSHTISLVAGGTSTASGTSWTTWSGNFIGDPLELTPTLTVMNASPDQNIDFIDNIVLTGPSASVPEPVPLSLFGAGLAGVFLRRRRVAHKA
jgi:hypothetical protein